MKLRDPYRDYPPEQQMVLGMLWGTVAGLLVLFAAGLLWLWLG